MDSLFKSVSAVTTTEITSPNMNNVSEIFLIFNMIAGRFEIIAIVYFFLDIKEKTLANSLQQST